MTLEKVTEAGSIPLDRLVGGPAPVQVVWLEPAQAVSTGPPRAPHRHDYHELFLLEAGTIEHVVDGELVRMPAGTVLLLGRGQVHTLASSDGAGGAVVRFTDDLLTGAAQLTSPGWSLVHHAPCLLQPPAAELARLTSLVRLLDAELRRPADARTADLVTNHLSASLLLVDRWREAQSIEAPPRRGPDAELVHGFDRLLEAQFATHHDATWYAHELGVSPAHLASVLTALTGSSTKRLVGDRIVREAQRLLRHTDLSVQQIAQRVGYSDPLYFSRAFKARVGLAPGHFRDRARSG